MASILCPNCKSGIHYHGIPEKIEYVVINRSDWDRITTTCFDSANKIVDPKTGYPKLFQTDTITEDFPEAIHKFWKCPNCGTILFFDNKGCMKAAYMPNSEPYISSIELETGYYFDDYQWDEITEAGYSDHELKEKIQILNRIFVDEEKVILQDAITNNYYQYDRLK